MADRNNPDFLSAKTIKSDKVVNRAGEDLGKIEELMIDLENGRIGYVVLSFGGGFLGMGDRLFAIPWQALSLRLHEHVFVLDVPKDVLQRAEGFDKDRWPITREELFRTYTYYGYQPYWQVESERFARTESTVSKEIPDLLSSDSIKSDKVVNRDGEDLGKIEELMIDLENGRIGYVVLSFGGFLGMGDKLFAIPWQALKLRPHEHAFTLNIPRDVLKRAEGFDKDRWPLTREELSRIYTYYGYQAYWHAEAARQVGTSTRMPGETESERTARMERERQTGMPRDRT